MFREIPIIIADVLFDISQHIAEISRAGVLQENSKDSYSEMLIKNVAAMALLGFAICFAGTSQVIYRWQTNG